MDSDFNKLKIFMLMQEANSMIEIFNFDDFMLAFCKSNSEEWWNYVLANKVISKTNLQNIENFFKRNNRFSSVYTLDNQNNDSLINFLKREGYNKSIEDSWLEWNLEKPQIDSKNIIEIKTDTDFAIWIETYLKSYLDNDPKNPYGEQSEFAETLKKSWSGRNMNSHKKYFLAFKDQKPVATAILTSFTKLGYISEVGSIPQVRGQGYGKLVSLHCVKESFNCGNRFHLLATEEGHYPYIFYQKIGFIPKFKAVLYSKKKL